MYKYQASIVMKSSAEAQEVSVMANNEQEAIAKIESLPEFASFHSLPVRDTN